MDALPLDVEILKFLIALARLSDGPTFFLICDEGQQCRIYEQMLQGKCWR